MDLDLRQLIRLARRWWALLLLAPLISGFAAYYFEPRLRDEPTPSYTAQATLLISAAGPSGLPSFSLRTYAELINTSRVLQPVINQLGLSFTVDDVRDMVIARPLEDTRSAGGYANIIWLSVSDTDPQQAADIANAVAASFVTYFAEQTIELTAPYRAELDRQIETTDARIDEIGQEIERLQQGGNAETAAAQTQVETLQAELSQLQEDNAQRRRTIQEMELDAAAASSQATVAEQASAPAVSEPVSSGLPATPLGAAAGLLFAAAIVLLFELFDDAVRAGANFPAIAGAPLLSVVPKMTKLRPGREHLFSLWRPTSPAAESIRLLRTSVELLRGSDDEQSLISLAISSPGPAEGKSTVTANLGLALAQSGSSVVIIDGDLRHPNQHQLFESPNERGLSTLLSRPELDWRWASVDTTVPNLILIPSGPEVANAADLLSPDRLSTLLREIGQTVDFVLVDTPPVLVGSEAMAVCASAHGVILVCQSRRTQIDALRGAAAALRQGTARLLGVVVNQQRGRDTLHHYHNQDAHDAENLLDERERLPSRHEPRPNGSARGGVPVAGPRRPAKPTTRSTVGGR